MKGRQLPEQHTSPDRLLHSLERGDDGELRPIPVEQAMDEIAESGPLSVVTYTGTYSLANMGTAPLQNAFMAAIGNPRAFGAISIDQPGKSIAQGLTGIWMAPGQSPAEADVCLIIGGNPLISISGGLAQANPRRWLHDAKQRGYKLIVVDPRRTETASQADLHLQPRPGDDTAIVAAMLRVILEEGLYDEEFVAEHVQGLDAFRRAVAPGMSNYLDMLAAYAPGYGMPRPWGQYAPQLVDTPAGSDVIPEWELFFGLAARMGLQLDVRPVDFSGPTGETTPLDVSSKPTADELLAIIAAKARVPLDEVKRHPNGAIFDDPSIVVLPKDDGWEGRFDIGNELMIADLATVAERDSGDASSWAGEAYPFRLISRRTNSRYNSGGHMLTKLRESDPYNPAYMHVDDLAALGLSDGDVIELSSARAMILAIVAVDETLRRGLISMSHSWGDIPEYDEDVRRTGSPISRLLDVDDAYDPYSGQPVMSNVPIAVRAHVREAASV